MVNTEVVNFELTTSTLRRVKFLTRREATRRSFNAKRRDEIYT